MPKFIKIKNYTININKIASIREVKEEKNVIITNHVIIILTTDGRCHTLRDLDKKSYDNFFEKINKYLI